MGTSLAVRVRFAATALLSGIALMLSSGALGQNAGRAVVIYGDADNGAAFAALLRGAGMTCEQIAQSEVGGDWRAQADLVVFLSCCRGGYGRRSGWDLGLLDRLGTARVLACGDSGAALLQTKQLLVGHPHG